MIFQILSSYPHNLHYLNRYINFIINCQKINVNKENLEYHHICPKAKNLFPQYSNLKENPWNLAKLTYKQHYIAHKILTKVYLNLKQKSSSLKAFYMMSRISTTQEYRFINSKMYEECKKANRLSMKLNNPMKKEAAKNKMRESWNKFLNSKEGEIWKRNQSEYRKGKNFISEKGYESLKSRWEGTLRPKTKEHIKNHRKKVSIGVFKTPFGDFDSPNEASQDIHNISKISRYLINKFCKNQEDGFSFIPKIKT